MYVCRRLSWAVDGYGADVDTNQTRARYCYCSSYLLEIDHLPRCLSMCLEGTYLNGWCALGILTSKVVFDDGCYVMRRGGLTLHSILQHGLFVASIHPSVSKHAYSSVWFVLLLYYREFPTS